MNKEEAIQIFREECLENQKEGHAGDVAPQSSRDSDGSNGLPTKK